MGQAHFFIEEENKYPLDKYTKIAKSQYTWIINGVAIKYATGQYDIPTHTRQAFDTIVFQDIHSKYGVVSKRGKTIKDTTRRIILCKLRNNHNYKLGQIYPGDFEIYSLDTFCSKLSVNFTLSNKVDNDTLYFVGCGSQVLVKSDTTFSVVNSNQKMGLSFTSEIQLVNRWGEIWFDGPIVPNDDVFSVSFLFLHEETLGIQFDYTTKKLLLRIE